MRQGNLPRSILALVGGTIMLFCEAARTQDTTSSRSFYIVTHVFSDDLASGYDEILQVMPQGTDVCVRVIRISLPTGIAAGSSSVPPNTYSRTPRYKRLRGILTFVLTPSGRWQRH
jgi:hypothetical protein